MVLINLKEKPKAPPSPQPNKDGAPKPVPPSQYNVTVIGVFDSNLVTAKSKDYAEGVIEGAIRTKYPEFKVARVTSELVPQK